MTPFSFDVIINVHYAQIAQYDMLWLDYQIKHARNTTTTNTTVYIQKICLCALKLEALIEQ